MPDTVSFEHYEVLTRDDGSLFELGRGAMGVTYKAFDTSLRVPVALKVINATYLNSDVARQRFIREAQSAAKLRHRNVATVYHLGTEGDAWFYAMEFIDGETLDALVKRHGPLEPALALQIAAQVARALNAAVPHGLVHRDIKPANLMLVREDDELVVKVIDFGLALTSLPGEEQQEATGAFVGTPHFASPEQFTSQELDVRSDIYSLGITLWYMLAGRTPFSGPVEQVKRKHLVQPPPFEEFKTLPEPVLAILRKALEKEVANRYQTPQELRRAAEECIEQISETGAEESGLNSLLDTVQDRAGESQFETNAVIAGFCQIVQSTGETNIGRTFRCYDPERQRHIRLLVLNKDYGAGGPAFTQIEREVEKIVPVQHENLLGIYEFATIEGSSFLVMEWTEGFTVLELLRARRELEATETLALLQQAARGADHAVSVGLKCIDFALHQISIHFEQPIEKEKLLHAPLLTWPAFKVKLNPLGITREINAAETWAGAQTMVQSATSAAENLDVRVRYVQSLGAVAYELLGGSISPVSLPGCGNRLGSCYTPLSTLSEEGNEVLKQALDPTQSFANAQEFHEALKNLEVLGIRPPQARGPIGSGLRHATVADSLSSTRAGSGISRSGFTPAGSTHATTVPPRKKKGIPVKFLGGLMTATIIGAGVYYLTPRDGTHPSAEPASETVAVAPDEPGGNPSPTEPPPVVAPPPVAEVKPEPPAENAALTMRDVKLHSAIAAAETAEKSGDPAKAIAGWLEVAREFPDSDAPRKRLDFVIDPLRKRAELKKPEIFDTLKPLLVEAAQLDSLTAVQLLAEGEQGRNLKESFAWYSTAAAKGWPEAYRQMGLIVSNGIDGQPDPDKAFQYFSLAVEKNDTDARAALAECYLFGKGTEKNIPQGVKLLREAADRGNLRAMNRLADGFDHGRYNLPVDYDEAFRIWSKVIEVRDPGGQQRQPIGEAHGNLGVLYMNGHGTTQDETRAVKLFTEGVRLGDANSMYFLALCHQDGRGGLSKNGTEAKRLFVRGAEAGSKPAQGWCRNNSVPFEDKER